MKLIVLTKLTEQKILENASSFAIIKVAFIWWHTEKIRSSRPELFCEKKIVINFLKLTWRHLCRSLFFKKVTDWGLQLYLKNLRYRCFSVNFAKFLGMCIFFIEHVWRILLKIHGTENLRNVKFLPCYK